MYEWHFPSRLKVGGAESLKVGELALLHFSGFSHHWGYWKMACVPWDGRHILHFQVTLVSPWVNVVGNGAPNPWNPRLSPCNQILLQFILSVWGWSELEEPICLLFLVFPPSNGDQWILVSSFLCLHLTLGLVIERAVSVVTVFEFADNELYSLTPKSEEKSTGRLRVGCQVPGLC